MRDDAKGDATENRPVRLARGIQHVLPVALLLVAVLELVALLPVPLESLAPGDGAALLGPASFLALSLAVVWSAFLPPSPLALKVKAITTVGVLGVVVTRTLLVVLWATGDTDGETVGWSVLLMVMAGLLLGLVLVVWSVVDTFANRSLLATHTAPAAVQPVTPSHAVSRPITPIPATDTEAVSASTPMRAPSPEPPPAPDATAPVPDAPQPSWQSVSTPWPRRDEGDPDGTVIRSPRRGRPRN